MSEERARRWTTRWVWFVWAASLVLMAVKFAADETNDPLAEDWLIVPALTGTEPDFGGWLWSQNNEHRVPVSRLLMLGILHATGGLFLAIGWCNLALLAAMSAGLLVVAKRLRGRPDVADAFFSLLLLNWGHSVHVLFSFQNTFLLPIAAVFLLGALFFRPETLRRKRWAVLAGVALIILPLSGFVGLLFLPALGGMMGWVAWQAAREPGPGRVAGMVLGAGVVGAFAAGAVYFVGYETLWWNPPSPGWRLSARAALRVLAMGLGVSAEDRWGGFATAVVGLGLATVWCLATAWRRGVAKGRTTVAWAGLFVFTTFGYAIAIGWGRAGWVPQFGIPSRYALLVAPAMVSSFLAWTLCGGRITQRWVPRGLAAALLVLLPWNTRAGDRYFADWYREGMRGFHRELNAGVPVEDLAQRHGGFLYHAMSPEVLAEHMRKLRAAGVTPFDRAAERWTGLRPEAESGSASAQK